MSEEAPLNATAALTGEAPTESAPPAEPSAPSGDAAPASNDSPWFSTIENEETRGYAEQKNWKNMEAAVESARNLEKLKGVPEEQLLKLPKDMNDAEAMKAIYDRLGKPGEASGYKLEGHEYGDDTKWLMDAMHSSNLSDAQAKPLMDAIAAQNEAAIEQANEAFSQQAQVDLQELKTEWGAAHDAKIGAAKNIIGKLGLDTETLSGMEQSMGTKAFMNTLAAMGEMIGETKALDLQDPNSSLGNKLSPEGAQSKLSSLNNDPDFQTRLMSPDRKIREAAINERSLLSKMAYDHG